MVLKLASVMLLAQESVPEAGSAAQPALIITLALFALIGIAVAVWALRKRKPVKVSYFHVSCPDCGRRERYREEQASHKGRCSGCARELVYLPTAESND